MYLLTSDIQRVNVKIAISLIEGFTGNLLAFFSSIFDYLANFHSD